MRKVLVIGYGNPLRSDDRFGWSVAEQLRQAELGENVEIITCQQLGLELCDSVSQSELVLFADASIRGETPGAMETKVVQATGPCGGSNTHYLEPSALLASALVLHGAKPESMIFTATGESFDVGEALSPAVAEAVPITVTRIRNILAIRGWNRA